MSDDGLRLTAYLGERDRAGGGWLADAVTAVHEGHGVEASLLLRGAAGFGARHQRRTDRQLTLSEDLPLVSVAVDRRERIERVAAELAALRLSAPVTLERVRILRGGDPVPELPESAKLTVYVGRHERAATGPVAFRAVVDLLHERGIAGATVLLGVDGTVHGARARAGFFRRNAEVPLMIVAVGRAARIAAVVPEIAALLARPLMTLEREQVCKRDGELLAEPRPLPATDGPGGVSRQRLTVYAGEQSAHAGHPLAAQLLLRLREAGAPGMTSLRGIWGYHGDHAPHGDRFGQLRRRVPVVAVVIDAPERIARWFEIVDELTDEAGLVTLTEDEIGSPGFSCVDLADSG